MTPQEQAQVVMKACGVESVLTAAISADAIRAAVDLVLPEDHGQSEYANQRMIKRAQFLAIAAELEGPANGN